MTSAVTRASGRRAGTASGRPASTDEPRGRTRALLGISLGYFMVLLDMTVLSVAEPDLAASLGSAVAGLQWAITGYTVAFGALLLSAGALADRFGAHRMFRIGVAAFGLGSALSAFAPNLGTLVALRALLGVAAAMCVPASMAMITRLYPEAALRARAVATWAAISGAAVAAGPVVGGVLVDLAGWRAIFLVNLPIALLVLGLTAGPAVRCPLGDRRIDPAAQLMVCAALALATDALIAVGSGAWTHTAWSAAAAVLAGIVFAMLERRSATPVLNRALLRTRDVRAALLAGAAVNFTLTGGLFVLPLLLAQDRHLSPVASGLAFLPLTIPFALNPPITGRIVARVGARPPILVGLALLVVGGAILSCATLTGAGYGWLALGLVLTGFGVSFAMPALVSAIVNAAPAGTAGAAGGLLNAVRQLGATLGVAVMGAFVTVRASEANPHGAGVALALPAIVCAVAAIAFVGTSRRRDQSA
ncbi:MFS transporter [Solihabitans fulvus]|uniref:MFS transporter n=1 Tax=Solihabitans fulvus TaxID=1892852 RepID=A0A5B2XUS6_9PSEU|nr:MFS transporter [Solihabitans fulvus]KAA2267053.1 MFS transporter [Solihabitans fulvus]